MDEVTTLLAEDARNKRLIAALRGAMQRVVRALSGRPTSVRLSGIDGVGFTDGEDIYLGHERMMDNLRTYKGEEGVAFTVLSIKGLIYHELGHILYTPRTTEDYVRGWKLNAPQFDAFNILEDQRLETLFSATFPLAAEYFKATVYRYMATSDPSEMAQIYPLIYGRKFLPKELRMSSRALFVKKYGIAAAEAIEDVIEQYVEVTFPGHSLKAVQLIRLFCQILLNNSVQPPNITESAPNSSLVNGQLSPSAQAKAKEAFAQEQHEEDEGEGAADGSDSATAKPADTGTEDAEDGESGSKPEGDEGNLDEGNDDSEACDAPAGSDADGEDQDGTAGTATGQGPDDDQVGDGEVGTESSDGIGTSGKSADELINDAVAALQDMLDEDSGSSVAKDIASITKNVIESSADAKNFNAPPYKEGDLLKPSPATLTALRKTTMELKKLKLELEPERLHRQTSGRVNMQRAMAADDHEVDVFDFWDDASEETGGVEAVILLDLSGSMGGVSQQTSEMMWMLKRAFESIDARTTVLGFGSDAYALIRGDDKVNRSLYRLYRAADPATFASAALTGAHGILKSSRKANRLLVTITDGGFADSQQSLEVAENIGLLPGTTTALVLIDQRSTGGDPNRGHHLAVEIGRNDIQSIVPMAVEMVKQAMRTAIMQK